MKQIECKQFRKKKCNHINTPCIFLKEETPTELYYECPIHMALTYNQLIGKTKMKS